MQFLANRQSTLTFELQTFRGNQVEMENFKGLLIATRVKLVQVFNEMMDMAEKGKFIFIFDRRIINQASREK